MRTVEVKVFQFDELSDAAKEKARDWYKEGNDFDPEFESFETAAKLLGITFGTRTVSLMSGKTREETDIRYSGFSSQGDGASFVGSYEFAKGCSKAIRNEFPEDKTLHHIADALTVLQSRKVLAFQSREPITATIKQSGHYSHKYTMDIELDEGTVYMSDDETKELLELMRDFAQWIYDALEAEYDYQQKDETVDDNIIANEYEFTEEGERA